MVCVNVAAMSQPDHPELRLRGEALLIVLLQVGVLLAALVS